MTFLPALISAAGSIGGGYLAGRNSGQKETKTQKMQRKLVDDLLASLQGNGPYSSLYNTSDADFQKSFVDPAKARFNNQIAPQIQQQYIASGQQRGTGLDDQLLRAGVDLDQLLNENFLQYQNQGKDRMQSTLNAVLGLGAGPQQGMGGQQVFGNAASGYLSSNAFSNDISSIFKDQQQQPNYSQSTVNQNPMFQPPRKGYQNDYQLPAFNAYAR